MTDRGVIFSGPMVRALLAGRKTQTRRLATSPLRRCATGDQLWVREGFSIEALGGGSVAGIGEWAYEVEYRCGGTREMTFVGDYRDDPYLASYDTQRGDWRPSIHMPRWASRLTLIVEDVRVEPLQAITEADARAEGISESACLGPHRGPNATYFCVESGDENGRTTARQSYAALWDSLHTKPGERWSDNPSVVALTFRVIAGNIDAIGGDA